MDRLTERQQKLLTPFAHEIQKIFPDLNPTALKGIMRTTVERYEQESDYTMNELEHLEDLQIRFQEVKRMGDIFARLLVEYFDMDEEKVRESLTYVYKWYWDTVNAQKEAS